MHHCVKRGLLSWLQRKVFTFKVVGGWPPVATKEATFGPVVVLVRKVLKGKDLDLWPLHLFIGITSTSSSESELVSIVKTWYPRLLPTFEQTVQPLRLCFARPLHTVRNK